jgi:hypothetical protein
MKNFYSIFYVITILGVGFALWSLRKPQYHGQVERTDTPETAAKKKGDHTTDARQNGKGTRGPDMTNARGQHQFKGNNEEQK